MMLDARPLFVAALATLGILFGGELGILAGAAYADDAPASPPASPPIAVDTDPTEPPLDGKEKQEHEKAVKELLAALHGEKNREMVRGRIVNLGVVGTRVGRDALMQFATNNKNQDFVNESFQALSKIGDNVALHFLCSKAALRSSNFLVQMSAAEAVAKTKNPRATTALHEILTHRAAKIEVIGAAAKALAQCAPPGHASLQAIFVFANHKKDTIRANALEALGYLATDEALARLTDALQNDKNGRIRGAAATGMAHSKHKAMIPVLRAALEAESAFQVKNAIMEALDKLEKSS